MLPSHICHNDHQLSNICDVGLLGLAVRVRAGIYGNSCLCWGILVCRQACSNSPITPPSSVAGSGSGNYKIQQSQRTTCREQYYRVTWTGNLSGHGLEGICNWPAVHMKEDGDGTMNWTTGCIQLDTRSGMIEGTGTMDTRAIQEASICNMEQIE